MMQYNLLYYTESAPSGCNSNESYLAEKDQSFKTIMQYEQPDVLCVNEIGSQSIYIERFLNNVLNSDSINYYAHCPLTNFSGGSIANMLYYNTNKLGFHSHFYIATNTRDINGYKMFYKSNTLLQGDTIFITFLIAHLKAGNYEDYGEYRLQEVQRMMMKIEQIGRADNYVFSGDFNLIGAEEEAYQYVTNYPNSLYKFYDPTNQAGPWHNNYQYRNLHTQSTHDVSENGCYVTGGLDDRFDLILVSPYLYYGSKNILALRDTYEAIGQDGNRFNGTITSPENNSIPSEIADALYTASDHLPVVLKFKVDATLSIQEINNSFLVNVANPISNQINFNILSYNDNLLTFNIYSIDGRCIESFTRQVETGEISFQHDFNYPSALYILQITDKNKHTICKKIVKCK